MILGAKSYILVTVVVWGIAVIGYQTFRVGSLEKDILLLSDTKNKLELASNLEKEAIEELETQLGNTLEINKTLNEALVEGNTKKQKAITELNSFRNRLTKNAIKKPALVETRATDALSGLLHEFSRETGSINHPN